MIEESGNDCGSLGFWGLVLLFVIIAVHMIHKIAPHDGNHHDDEE